VESVEGSSEERRKCMKGGHSGSVIAAEEVMCIFRGAATEGWASSGDGLIKSELLGLEREKEVDPFC
jgi:hypothetical protein